MKPLKDEDKTTNTFNNIKKLYTTEIEQIRDYLKQELDNKHISSKEFIDENKELSLIKWIPLSIAEAREKELIEEIDFKENRISDLLVERDIGKWREKAIKQERERTINEVKDWLYDM